MTVAIECTDCGQEVVFVFGRSEEPPTEECDCGAVYKLMIKRVYPAP